MSKTGLDINAHVHKGQICVRVSPRASRNQIVITPEQVRAYVTCVPENGKANKAVIKLLARSLGQAPSSITLIRGQTSRDKVFQIEN